MLRLTAVERVEREAIDRTLRSGGIIVMLSQGRPLTNPIRVQNAMSGGAFATIGRMPKNVKPVPSLARFPQDSSERGVLCIGEQLLQRIVAGGVLGNELPEATSNKKEVRP
jgi:hypothetical protein